MESNLTIPIRNRMNEIKAFIHFLGTGTVTHFVLCVGPSAHFILQSFVDKFVDRKRLRFVLVWYHPKKFNNLVEN